MLAFEWMSSLGGQVKTTPPSLSPLIHEVVDRGEHPVDVGNMQAGGRLVEDDP